MNVSLYRSFTKEKLLHLLDRSFVPDLSNYKTFIVNEMVQDIILVEGILLDYNTKDVYVAPCYIPRYVSENDQKQTKLTHIFRTIQKLVFSNSSLVNFEVPVETRLMILPAQNCNEYEIMFAEGAICEMVGKYFVINLKKNFLGG